MDFGAALADVRRTCVEHLGEPLGRQLAELARPGFQLHPVLDGPGSGRCALGGPALLTPGTPWPEYAGIPLSLLAVLDTDALAPWLGEFLPRRVGLLNFFYFLPDLPYDRYAHLDLAAPGSWRVIPAAAATAVPVPPPAPAPTFQPVPLRAEPVPSLPDPWDDSVRGLDPGPGREGWPPELELSGFEKVWSARYGRHPNLAFGWPRLESASPIVRGSERHTQLIQLDHQVTQGAVIYYTIPTDAFRAGDFDQALAVLETF